MINTMNLKLMYATDEVETAALNNANIEINEGEFVTIMGPSGCGKSTLLDIPGLFDNLSDGEYHFVGQEVSKYTDRQRANLRKANIGFVFQSFNLIDELTVFENVELPLFYLGVASTKREKRVNEVLEHGGDAPEEPFSPAVFRGATATCGGLTSHRCETQVDPGG